MTQLEQKYVDTFTPHSVEYALKQIEKQVQFFTDGIRSVHIVDAFKKIGVNQTAASDGEQNFNFETPLGVIKVSFLKRLEGAYLGVAASFSFRNSQGQDVPFFTVSMNHQSAWEDSSGHKFRMSEWEEKPAVLELVGLMQRVLGMRLQLQDGVLAAI